MERGADRQLDSAADAASLGRLDGQIDGRRGAADDDLSGRIVSDKCDQIAQTEADTVLGGDLGCLLNIAGRLRREGSDLKVFHVAEVLAGMTDGPAIGEAESEDTA